MRLSSSSFDKIILSPRNPPRKRCPDSWGSHSLGPEAEIFLLDARNGSLGDEQVHWIFEAVRESKRTWKVGRKALASARFCERAAYLRALCRTVRDI